MDNVKADVFNVLVFLAKAYRKETIPQETLEIYTEYLVDELSVIELKKTFSKILKTCKFFPSIAEIIELARPASDSNEEAIIIANKVLECARSFSYADIKGAREFLGEHFAIAERYGWRNLVELQNDDLSTARAQLRELAKAHINYKKRNSDLDLITLCPSEVTTPLLKPLSDTLSIAKGE